MPELIAVTSWHIWWQRRKIEKGEEVQNLERSSQAILATALNFVRAATPKVSLQKINTWLRPLNGQLVLNTDASFLDDHTESCGAVIRDHLGYFIAASTAKLDHVADVVTAEAAALLEGLKLSQTIGAHNLVARTDNATLVEAMVNNSGQDMVAGPILEGCRSLCLDFGKVFFQHCNRECNLVAHRLAQSGREDQPTLWLDSPLVLFRFYLRTM
ncbi:hypothetical protein ACQJBY_054713 [Aegilops geniculata]